MSWLSGKELQTKIRNNADGATLHAFHGIFSMDELPFSVPLYPFFMIVNTHAHNLPGEHWISIFIDGNRRGEVFDSLALPLSNLFIRWINRFTRSFSSNRLRYQHPLSSTCGAFALYFILHRLHDSDCIVRVFNSSLYENEQRVLVFYESLK